MKISIKVLLVFFALMGGFSKTYASKTILGASVFNPTDVTNEIRNAINSSVDTVIIQNVGQPWIVQPLTFFNKDARTIIFEPGVILQAKSGAFTQTYATLFKLKDCTNFKIYGYGATFKMLKTEYTTGEWRHAVDLSDCTNITIAGLMVNDSGGDGLLITGYAGGTNNQNFCENIYVVNCVFDNNRRQGCSIISAKNVLIENCTFSNTKGTLPEAGLDIEPDFPEQFVQNIKIRKCRFTNNYGAGLVFAFHLLNSSSPTVSVTVENSYFSFNHDITNVYATTEIQLSEAPNVNLTGQIVFNKCFVDGSNWTAFYVNKGNNGLTVAFNDCVFKDVSQNTANVYNNPIWIEIPGDYVSPLNYYLGGITFTNSLLTYSTNYKFAWINGWTNLPGAKDINLGLTVIHPTLNTAANNSAVFSNCATIVNCNTTVNYLSVMPNNNITVKTLNAAPVYKSDCPTKSILFERGITQNFPIAYNYTTTGTAQNGFDFNRLVGFALIKANNTQRLDTLTAINPTLGLPSSTVQLTAISSGNLLAVAPNFSAIINATLLPLASPIDDYSSGTVIKQANASTGKITATNKITNTANVTYQAGKSIVLEPGFKANAGTVFKVQLGGCN